jgi:hypothetical protein
LAAGFRLVSASTGTPNPAPIFHRLQLRHGLTQVPLAPLPELLQPVGGTVFYTVPALEPTSHLQPATTDAQLAATIEAWQLACAQGWQEPEPECLQAELSLPAADQGLLGSAWDSWSSNS